MRILVVDDDPHICSLLQRGLSYEGFQVETAVDGLQALAKARDNGPDLVVLDILLPGLDGLEVARRLKQGSQCPILMLTAKGMLVDKVAGFDAGADDYLVKPFDFDELVVRIRALLRRCHPEQGEILRFRNIVMDTSTREVTHTGEPISFSMKEFDLLELFLRNPRKVLTRKVIFERVWGLDFGADSNVIEVYVRYLRAKLEKGGRPCPIHTVRGVGYVLKD
ncbi:MAG: response regulator transcription factor [Chloroflexi bacterium]|nr:response regulator transcription factor [Chloroflexota bacterium]